MKLISQDGVKYQIKDEMIDLSPYLSVLRDTKVHVEKDTSGEYIEMCYPSELLGDYVDYINGLEFKVNPLFDEMCHSSSDENTLAKELIEYCFKHNLPSLPRNYRITIEDSVTEPTEDMKEWCIRLDQFIIPKKIVDKYNLNDAFIAIYINDTDISHIKSYNILVYYLGEYLSDEDNKRINDICSREHWQPFPLYHRLRINRIKELGVCYHLYISRMLYHNPKEILYMTPGVGVFYHRGKRYTTWEGRSGRYGTQHINPSNVIPVIFDSQSTFIYQMPSDVHEQFLTQQALIIDACMGQYEQSGATLMSANLESYIDYFKELHPNQGNEILLFQSLASHVDRLAYRAKCHPLDIMQRRLETSVLPYLTHRHKIIIPMIMALPIHLIIYFRDVLRIMCNSIG